MSSIKCVRCGFVSFADAEHCKRCGNALQVAQRGADAQHYPSPFQPFADGTKKRTGLAVASLVLGLFGLPTLGLVGVGAITGLILGVMALTRANRRPQEYGGRGLAIGGIVLNGVAILIIPVVGIVAAVAIPNLLASRRAANEGSAISSIRAISTAEATFFATTGGDQKYATLEQLSSEGLIDPDLSDGTKNGYHFDLTTESNGFVLLATPVSYPSTGVRSFYYSPDEEGVRAGDEHGSRASSETPLLAERPYPAGKVGTYAPGVGDGREAVGLRP